jgi:YHS domain-containing protein
MKKSSTNHRCWERGATQATEGGSALKGPSKAQTRHAGTNHHSGGFEASQATEGGSASEGPSRAQTRHAGAKKAAAALLLLVAAAYYPARAEAVNAPAASGAVPRLASVRESYLASLRRAAIMAKRQVAADIRAVSPASRWLTRVMADEVNMATNRRAGKGLPALSLGGKTYFWSGEGCALNLIANPSVRFARDPLTEERVDKAEAVIYADASGRAHYFKSEETYRGFIGLASSMAKGY